MIRRPLTAAALALACVAAAGTGTAGAATNDARGGSPHTLLQMNLCLSGAAGCYDDTDYPAVVDEAVARIEGNDADAVTLNEACSGDAERIAEETGYHVRFATVIYRGAPFTCRDPQGRGVFGNAVLTKERIASSRDRAFGAQAGVEERRWLCATTARGVNVCTAHLSTRGSVEARAANDAQCAELSSVLASYGSRAATVFAGDVNRRGSCAAPGMWTLTDAEASQAPGIQHAYGDPAFADPAAETEPTVHTDHDALVVRSRLAAAAHR